MLLKGVICLLLLYFISMIICEDESTEGIPRETGGPDGGDLKCPLPNITSPRRINMTRFRQEYANVTEVKFEYKNNIGPHKEKLLCKFKCVNGQWVGPLCANATDGRFQPILRECNNSNQHPLLAVSFKNTSIDIPTSFPHGSMIVARCKHFGHYKMKGESTIRCENGEWQPKLPECVPTTIITNFTGDAPPTIQYTVVSGSATVDPSGELLVFPESTLRLDCITPRALGDPEWSWTQALGHNTAAWSTDEGEKETHFRLTLSKMSARHSGLYTCTSPSGHTNTVVIKVVSVTCPPLNMSTPHLRQFAQGSRLGHAAHFSCQPGYHLNGSALLTCMGDGRWSSPPPTCIETFCPMLGALGPHLSVVEYNSSFGGRAVFQCSWGYRLVGPPGLECEQDGTWSGVTPHCIPIYCPDPIVPEKGRLVSEIAGKVKHPVGDLIVYSCEEGYEMVGESSIVCTETGYWSHPPPFCLLPADIRKTDTIYIENTTLVHVEE